ncbi:MAG TPA: hypothetical protein ENN07_00490 [candidate division Zixibacteria bacterium]|nr:hypothetical protein [candidate division Zixibacteria bacterium]
MNNYRSFLAIICLLTLSISSFAVTKNFTGAGGDNLWHNPANWDPVGVPDFTHDVVIPPGALVDLALEPVVFKNLQNLGLLGDAWKLFMLEGIDNQGRIEGLIDVPIEMIKIPAVVALFISNDVASEIYAPGGLYVNTGSGDVENRGDITSEGDKISIFWMDALGMALFNNQG